MNTKDLLAINEHKTKLGQKLVNPDAEDLAEFKAMEARLQAFNDQKAGIETGILELNLQSRKWWLKVRKKYSIKGDSLIFNNDDDAIYEGVDNK